MTITRILLVDDHEIVRKGLRALLKAHAGWEVCGEAANGREAVQMARQMKPDVVVLDISMPELNGLEAARQIRNLLPATEVLILTMYESDELVREVIEAGARAYVMKSDAAQDLAAAVEALEHHKPFFSSRVSEIVLRESLQPRLEGLQHGSHRGVLSPREREVVQLLAEGRSQKQVADRLGISKRTVETHRTNLMRRLGLHSLTEIVRYAIRNNIVQA